MISGLVAGDAVRRIPDGPAGDGLAAGLHIDHRQMGTQRFLPAAAGAGAQLFLGGLRQMLVVAGRRRLPAGLLEQQGQGHDGGGQ